MLSRFYRIITLCFITFIILSPCAYSCEYLQDEPEFSKTANEMIDGTFTLNPMEICRNFYESVTLEVKGSAHYILIFFIVGIMSTILNLLNTSFERSSSAQVAFFACFTLCSSIAVKLFFTSLSYAEDVVDDMTAFITKLSPILTTLIVASGKTVSAAAFHPILSAAIFLVTLICRHCIMPLATFAAILSIVNNMSEQIQISGFCRLINSSSKWIMTLSFTLFAGICGIYGFSAPSLDIMGAKTVKFAMGSLIPVVGNFLSETLETVISGSKMMKNTVGSAGIVVICGISSIPILKIAVIAFMIKFSSAVIEPLTDRKIAGLLSDISNAVMLLFAMLATVTVLFIICISIILSATG